MSAVSVLRQDRCPLSAVATGQMESIQNGQSPVAIAVCNTLTSVLYARGGAKVKRGLVSRPCQPPTARAARLELDPPSARELGQGQPIKMRGLGRLIEVRGRPIEVRGWPRPGWPGLCRQEARMPRLIQ